MGSKGSLVNFLLFVGFLLGTLIPVITTATLIPLSPAVSEDSNRSIPHYIITRISIPGEKTGISPGDSLSLDCLIQNTGENDTGMNPVQISVSLGIYPLILQHGIIPAMKRSEEHHVLLTYLIPDGIPPREYPLKVSIEQENNSFVNESDRVEMKGPDILVVKKTNAGVKRNGCGCT